jgi:hypothetical protein
MDGCSEHTARKITTLPGLTPASTLAPFPTFHPALPILLWTHRPITPQCLRVMNIIYSDKFIIILIKSTYNRFGNNGLMPCITKDVVQLNKIKSRCSDIRSLEQI